MELQQKTKTDHNGLIPPYGGELKNLIIKDKNLKNDLIYKANYEFECSERNACDVEPVSYTHLTLPTILRV